jgi:hypothetical protein
MELSAKNKENDDETNTEAGIQSLTQRSIKEAFKEELAYLLISTSRPLWLAMTLLIIHFIEIFSISIPFDLNVGSLFIPILHQYLTLLSIRNYDERVQMSFLVGGSCINILFLTFLYILTRIQRKKKNLRKIVIFMYFYLINLMRVYLPVLMVPMINISSIFLLNSPSSTFSQSLFTNLVSIFLLATTILISITLATWHCLLEYKIRDHLTTYPSLGNILNTILQCLVSFIFYVDSNINLLLAFVFYLFLLIDFCIRLPYSSRPISELYLNLI